MQSHKQPTQGIIDRPLVHQLTKIKFPNKLNPPSHFRRYEHIQPEFPKCALAPQTSSRFKACTVSHENATVMEQTTLPTRVISGDSSSVADDFSSVADDLWAMVSLRDRAN